MLGDVLFGLLVFVVAVVTDVVWAHYTMATSDRKPSRAAFWAVCIVFTGLFGWNAYHRSYWNVVPMAAGCWTGSFTSVWKDRERVRKEEAAKAAGQ